MAFTKSVLLCAVYALGAAAQSYTITNFDILGTGCPKGTALGTVTSNGQGLTVKYNSFNTAVGPNVDISQNRKNCQATVTVNVPAGYQFSLNRFIYDAGYALASGTSSTYETHYYFQASLPQGDGSGTINGAAYDSDNTLTHTVPAVWSPCGQSTIVGIDSSVQTSNGPPAASGSLTLKSLYIPPSSFNWRTC